MTTTDHLLDQLHKIYYGPCWVGTHVMLVLEDIDHQMAAARVNDQHLSIWQLTLHIAQWNIVVARRLKGEPYIPAHEVDFPVITDTSAIAWESAKNELSSSYNLMRSDIESMDPAHMDAPILPDFSSCYNHISGVLLHTMYHAGQIGLLKKILSNPV